MSVIKGLDAIINPIPSNRPTEKQLAWVREHLGEEMLDKIIMLNYDRSQVAESIGKYIEDSKKNKRYTHRGYRHRIDDCIPTWENSWGDDW